MYAWGERARCDGGKVDPAGRRRWGQQAVIRLQSHAMDTETYGEYCIRTNGDIALYVVKLICMSAGTMAGSGDDGRKWARTNSTAPGKERLATVLRVLAALTGTDCHPGRLTCNGTHIDLDPALVAGSSGTVDLPPAYLVAVQGDERERMETWARGDGKNVKGESNEPNDAIKARHPQLTVTSQAGQPKTEDDLPKTKTFKDEAES
ncbi:hypothetical protein DFH07DRAFT_772891 [Mycena maculata]|uniref:Uncharacterized protein n=1 Tax=Mycena maculata TaxID=230809 RepID=A0AAD7J6F7_9AGAR|nr:hypothetical protein DFH07DRAFT_772891 [Mycena maculata]